MLFIRLLLASIFFINPSLSEKKDWKLRREEAGVKIYTRSVDGSPFEEFKGIVVISNTSLTRVLDVITDVKNYPNNFPNCGSAQVLEQKGKYSDIHYLTIKAPWPVADRDAIYEASTSFSNNGKRAIINLTPRGDYKEENKNFIRVHNGSGFWDLEEIAPGTVQVIYQFHADPEGEIPAWIANSVIVFNPLRTLESLRDLTSRI
ncbi:MAG: START domain-containing protein [Prolixibacteraceae bacterium]